MTLEFTKMNGAGNDFVMLDNRNGDCRLDRKTIAQLCDRHRGVGADGVLFVERRGSGLGMRYHNSDGGEAEMCGNGARCFARFAARLEGISDTLSFETGAGAVSATLSGGQVSLQMGTPHSGRTVNSLHNNTRDVYFLNTGVPHAVVFVEDLEAVDVPGEGAAIRNHPEFAPNGTNANFVKIAGPGSLQIRTYERGVEAETLACGTGVCAAALIYASQTERDQPVDVVVRGGDTLRVGFERTNGGYHRVVLTGPADFVFEGSISL